MSTNNSQQRLAYSVNQPLTPIFNYPVISLRDPGANDKQPLGTVWVNRSTNGVWILSSIVANAANWASVSGGAGSFASVTSTGPVATSAVSLPGPVTISSGAGAPANGLALHIGDMYINTTAASAVTRLYIATAVGTWTNVTCAA